MNTSIIKIIVSCLLLFYYQSTICKDFSGAWPMKKRSDVSLQEKQLLSILTTIKVIDQSYRIDDQALDDQALPEEEQNSIYICIPEIIQTITHAYEKIICVTVTYYLSINMQASLSEEIAHIIAECVINIIKIVFENSLNLFNNASDKFFIKKLQYSLLAFVLLLCIHYQLTIKKNEENQEHEKTKISLPISWYGKILKYCVLSKPSLSPYSLLYQNTKNRLDTELPSSEETSYVKAKFDYWG